MKSSFRSLVLFAIPAALLAACATTPPPPSSPEPARGRPALAPGDHVWKTADGNEMPYTVAGDGDVTVLLVHCWMCDRTFWSAQVPELAKRYRTVSIDLPGHGRATADRAVWTFAGYGEDVAGLIAGLDLSNVVLVGHSMGGPVSLRAAALAPKRVRGIVAVDTLQDAEFKFVPDQLEGYLASFESDYVGTCEPFIDQMIPEEGADEVRSRVREACCHTERSAVGIALLRDLGTIDMTKLFREAGVPIRAVNSAAPAPTKIETNRKYSDFDAVTMEGVGHYLHMTRPADFNPLLLAAISKLVGDVR